MKKSDFLSRCGVYKITHKPSGRIYIGSAKNILSRISSHKRSLRMGSHYNIYLQRVFNKDGEQSFNWLPVLFCSEEDRLFYEQLCMDAYNSYDKKNGFNIRDKAIGQPGVYGGNEAHRTAMKLIWSNPAYRERKHVATPGQKFGRITLVELREKTSGSYTWLCKCECGNEKLIRIGSLRKGYTKSCGCYHAESASKRRKEKTGVKTKFVELCGQKTHIRMAEINLGIAKNGIALKARTKNITLQEATDYFSAKLNISSSHNS